MGFVHEVVSNLWFDCQSPEFSTQFVDKVLSRGSLFFGWLPPFGFGDGGGLASLPISFDGPQILMTNYEGRIKSLESGMPAGQSDS